MADAAAPSPILQFLPLVFLFVIFYFMLIRPQQQKQKSHADMIAKLEAREADIIRIALRVFRGDPHVVVEILANVVFAPAVVREYSCDAWSHDDQRIEA